MPKTKEQQAEINKKISESMKKDRKLIVQRLEDAAKIGATVLEQCYYADISKDTRRRVLNEDPELRARLKVFQQKPKLKSRMNVVKKIEAEGDALKREDDARKEGKVPVGATDTPMSKWYLERSDREMKTTRQEIIDKTPQAIEGENDPNSSFNKTREAIVQALEKDVRQAALKERKEELKKKKK